MEGRIVLHVDMDAFFAAVEAREDPRLARVPLVIGADPKGGRGRGVVCTANYPARRYGIHSAMPISRAYAVCPHAVFLRPDGTKYRAVSREVMDILGGYADVLEVVGVDEAYLDVTGRTDGSFLRARSLARSLQAAVRRRTGLTCSIGVAPTKSVAKIASDHRKPHGITVVAPEDLERFLDPLPVGLVNGCGPKTARSLQEGGVETIGDLARSDPDWLQRRFGSHGLWLHRIARGDDPRPVCASQGPAKSRGNERTYPEDVVDPDRVHATAQRLLDGLLRGRDHRINHTTDGTVATPTLSAAIDRRPFTTLTVKIRYADFATLTRAHTVHVPLDPDVQEARAYAADVLARLLDPLLDGRAVRLVGVRLSGFLGSCGQQSLGAFGLQTPTCTTHIATPGT